jgi:sugar phosphate permease
MPVTRRGAAVQVAATSFAALFAIVGLALYGLPLYYDFIVRELGWSRVEVTSGNALSKLVVGPVFGFIAGWVVDRFGPRKLMMAGILMAGGALVGLSTVSTLGMFYFFYLFNALGYVCGGPLPNQILLSRWFDRARGKAMGFAYLGIGAGGALVPLLAHRLTESFGWRGSLRGLGLLIVVIALPLAWFVKESPDSRPDLQVGRDDQVGPKPGATRGAASTPGRPPLAPLGDVLRRPAFYLLAVGSMCSIAAVGGTNQHLKLFLSLDEHYSQADAAHFISLTLTFSLAGRLLMGWLADHVAKKRVMLLIYLLVASSVPLLFFAASRSVMYTFALVFGLGLGGEYLIIPLAAAELFGVRVLGRVMGIILTADGVAEATSPMLIGYLRDRTGSYDTGFLLLVGIALAGAAAIALLPRAGREPVPAGVS